MVKLHVIRSQSSSGDEKGQASTLEVENLIVSLILFVAAAVV